MEISLQLLLNTLATSGIYVLMGIGLSLIYRVSRVFHFAHGAIYTLGAYVFFTFMVQLNCPLIFAIILAVMISAFAGLGIDRFLYQPLTRRHVTGATLLIASLGAYIFLENLIALIYGSDTQVFLPGVQKTLKLLNASITITQFAEICFFILIVIAAIWIKRKPVGLRLRSVANDRTMATSLGLPVTKIRSIAFLVGSALAGLASCLTSMDSGAEPHMGMKALFVAIVAVFVGGPDIFLAPIVGGVFFSMLQVGGNYTLSSRWENTVAFVVLLLFMAFRPEGILGRSRRIEEKAEH